jgi:hypothetical protein
MRPVKHIIARSTQFILLGVYLLCSPASAALQIGGKPVSFQRVGVVVYAKKSPEANSLKRVAQTRLENILVDNSITVLDQDKAEDLKKVWKKLEDPGYFITAEDFVANAEKYEIDGLIRLYLNADATQGLANFYTATAQADIRFVDHEANVEAYSTVPMGVPGMPPSDGLTRNAALVNAIQRAVDEAAVKTGLEVLDYARPRTLSFDFSGPVTVEFTPNAVAEKVEHSFTAAANLVNKTWTTEEVSATCRAPSGELGAVGGYIRETSSGMRRSYASKIHLVDLTGNKEIGEFDSTTSKKKGIDGSVRLLDCLFIGSWRYLAAVTGLELFLWDTERGILMSSRRLDKGLEQAGLSYARYNNQDYISILSNVGQSHYQIVRKQQD